MAKRNILVCIVDKKECTKENCTIFSSNSTHNRVDCTSGNEVKCPSQWRVCTACAKQGIGANGGAQKENRARKGQLYCDFHFENGEKAKWNGNNQEPTTEEQLNTEEAVATSEKVEFKENGDGLANAKTSTKEKIAGKKGGKEIGEEKSLKVLVADNSLKAGVKVEEISLSLIIPNPDQPRKKFKQTSIEQLAVSIKKKGQSQAIQLRKLTKEEKKKYPGVKYSITDGERRYRACSLNDKDGTILGMVLEVKDSDSQYVDSAIANIGREDFTEVEQARIIGEFREKYGKTFQEIADLLGKSNSWVQQRFSLLKLDEKILKMLEDEELSCSICLQLVDLPKKKQIEYTEDIVRENMKFSTAAHHIRTRAAKDNIKVAGSKRKRKPSDDTRALGTYLKAANERLGHFSELPHERYDVMFPSGSSNINKVVAELDDMSMKISAIRRMVSKPSGRG